MIAEDKTVQKHIRRKFFRGKRGLAKILDAVLGRIAVFVVVFLIFWSLKMGIVKSAVLSATIVGVYSCLALAFRQRALTRFTEKYLRTISDECLFEKLLLQSQEDFREFCRQFFLEYTNALSLEKSFGGFLDGKQGIFCFVFKNHPANPVGPQQIQTLFRIVEHTKASHVFVLSSSDFLDKAREICLKQNYVILGKEKLLDFAKKSNIAPSEEEILNAIKAEITNEHHRQSLKSAFLAQGKRNSYLACAGVLLVWMFVMGFNVIYAVTAGLMVTLAVMSKPGEKA